jgi:CubicO group peptidase (beta-lactamase class C family)
MRAVLLLGLAAVSAVLADYAGPSYPYPKDISSNSSLVTAAWQNVSSTIKGLLDSSDPATASLKNFTFSLGLFSIYDAAAIEKLQFHYTSPEIAHAPNGTHSVDGNSIYRIASVTKVFTVLAGMLELKPTDWETPLTDIFPYLASAGKNSSHPDDPLYTVDWSLVTASNLAAQIAGVPRDGLPSFNEIALAYLNAPSPKTDPQRLALPDLATIAQDPLLNGPCVAELLQTATCGVTSYIETQADRPPVFEPWTQPAYANNGFSLLGLTIEALTNKTLAQIYNESIFNPLGMSNSFSVTPSQSGWARCVIVPDPVTGSPATYWQVDAEIFTSSGGLLSTTRDLARFGVGILNSTLMKPDVTRRWLKPVSFTARLDYALGRPWEIIRFTMPDSGKVVDVYTKLGDSGGYSAYLVLLPDYGVGFNVLVAGSSDGRSGVDAQLGDTILQTVLPALEAQATIEAGNSLAGTYANPTTHFSVNTTGTLNSSLTVALNETKGAAPGLHITSWISNGTDVLSKLPTDFGPGPYRLAPTIIDAGSTSLAFRLLGPTDAPDQRSPLKATIAAVDGLDWLLTDVPTYGGIGLGLFVFTLDASGKAQAVSPAAYRVSLSRTGDAPAVGGSPPAQAVNQSAAAPARRGLSLLWATPVALSATLMLM